MIRSYVAALPAIVGVGLLIYNMKAGHWIYGAIYLSAGVLVAWTFRSNFLEKILSAEYKAIAQGLSIAGILAAIYYLPAFHNEIQTAHHEASKSLLNAGTQCGPNSQRFAQLKEQGLMACQVQGELQAMEVVVELEKGANMGPTMSLVDGTHDALNDKAVDWCARIYLEATKMCPGIFIPVSKASEAALIEAAR